MIRGVLWAAGIAMCVALAAVECFYRATLAQVPVMPSPPEQTFVPRLLAEAYAAGNMGSRQPAVRGLWPWALLRLVTAVLRSRSRLDAQLPTHAARLLLFEQRRLRSGHWHAANFGLMVHLSRHWTEDQMLATVAERAYLGGGVVGWHCGARAFFGKDWRVLDASEAALLIGMAATPSRTDPWAHPARALKQRNRVLGQMGRTGVLSPRQVVELSASPLKVVADRRALDCG